MNNITQAAGTAGAMPARPGAAYRDIAVHLDGTPEDEVRLAHAEVLAGQQAGRITAIFTNVLPDPALFAGDFGITAIGQLVDAVAEEGDAVEKRLRQRLTRLGSPTSCVAWTLSPAFWRKPSPARRAGTICLSRHAPGTTIPRAGAR